jgi:hypothetical protein
MPELYWTKFSGFCVSGFNLSGISTTDYQKVNIGMSNRTVEWEIHCSGSKIWKPVKYWYAKGKERVLNRRTEYICRSLQTPLGNSADKAASLLWEGGESDLWLTARGRVYLVIEGWFTHWSITPPTYSFPEKEMENYVLEGWFQTFAASGVWKCLLHKRKETVQWD